MKYVCISGRKNCVYCLVRQFKILNNLQFIVNKMVFFRLKVLNFVFDVWVFYKFICMQWLLMIEDDLKFFFIFFGKINSYGLNILKLFVFDIYRINIME